MRVNSGSGNYLNGRRRPHVLRLGNLSFDLQTSLAAEFSARIRQISSVEINLNTRFAPSLVNLTLFCRRRRSYQEGKKLTRQKLITAPRCTVWPQVTSLIYSITGIISSRLRLCFCFQKFNLVVLNGSCAEMMKMHVRKYNFS